MPPTLPITIVGSSRRRPSEYAALVFEKKSSGESTFKGKGKRAAVTEEAIIVLKSKDGFIWNSDTIVSPFVRDTYSCSYSSSSSSYSSTSSFKNYVNSSNSGPVIHETPESGADKKGKGKAKQVEKKVEQNRTAEAMEEDFDPVTSIDIFVAEEDWIV